MNTAQRQIRTTSLLTAAAALALLAGRAPADFTWDGGGGDDLFTTDTNWVGDVAPGTDIGDMLLIFGATGAAQSPDAGADEYTGITGIRWTGADAALSIIGTGTFTFNDGASILNDSAFMQSIAVDLIATGDSLIIDAMAGDLVLDGALDLSDTGGVMLTVQGDNDTMISGIISGAGASIFKDGDGLLTLGGANTFNGGVELAGGGLVFGNDDALGTGELTVTGDGSTIESDSDDRIINSRINIADVELIITGSNDLELSNRILGDGSLTIDMDDATATAKLTRRNDYTGGTDLRRGTALIGANRAFGFGDVTVKGDFTLESDANSRTLNNNFEIRSGKILTFAGDRNLRLSGVLSGLGSFTVNTDSNGDLLFLRDNTFEGGTIINKGTIVLEGDNALGTGDLRLTGNGSLRSSFFGRTIDNRIRLEDNRLSIRGANSLTIDGKISGTGGLFIIFDDVDSRLTLTRDNTYSGLTDIVKGILQLDGSVGGDLTIREEGTLISSGTIGGDVIVEDGGTISPGFGLETLTIDGNLTLEDGSIFELDIDIDDSEFDILDVGGTATLADGSMISANVTGDAFVASGAMFDIITAAGGITDNGVEVMTESATLSFELIPDPGFTDGEMTFSLLVSRDATAYSDAADAGNNAAVGMSLDSIVPFANADPDGAVGSMLGSLDALDEDAFNDALREISPEPYNAAIRLGVEAARVYNLELARYLSARRTGMAAFQENQRLIMPRPGALAMANNDPTIIAAALAQVEADDDMEMLDESEGRRYSVFGQFHGSFIDQDTDGNRTGFDGEVFGGQGGIDWEINDNLIAGVAFGYSHADADWNLNNGSIQDDTIRGGPYVSYTKGPLAIDASVSFGYHHYEADRDLLSVGLNPESDFDGYDITAYLRGAYEFEIADNIFLTPNGSVQYSYFNIDGFTEDNAGGAGLSVDDRDESSLRTRLGVELSGKFDAGLVIVPSVFGGWEREWAGDTDDIDASFSAGGVPFSVDNGPRDEDTFFVGVGVNVLFHRDVAGFLRIERGFGDDTDVDTIAGGLTFKF